MSDVEILQTFVEGTTDFALSIKPDGILEYVNQAWLNTFHYTLDEISAIALEDIVFPGHNVRTEEALSQVLSGNNIPSFATTLIDKDGTPVQVEGRLFPRYQDNKVVSVICIFRDINKQNHLLNELRHEQARREFLIDIMAHDLTNINQEMLSTIEVALHSPDIPPILEDLLRESITEIDRASTLVSNVKQLWYIARKAPQMLRVDIGELLRVAAEEVEESFPHKQMNFKTNLGIGQFYVTADQYLIEVFKSLFHNAMKFDKRKQVRIEVMVENLPQTPFLKIHVQDYGPGILDEDKAKLFEQLSQKRESLRGLGLGLSLVKHVLENYGGYIRVEDRVKGKPDKGTNFIMLLRHSPRLERSPKQKGGAN